MKKVFHLIVCMLIWSSKKWNKFYPVTAPTIHISIILVNSILILVVFLYSSLHICFHNITLHFNYFCISIPLLEYVLSFFIFSLVCRVKRRALEPDYEGSNLSFFRDSLCELEWVTWFLWPRAQFYKIWKMINPTHRPVMRIKWVNLWK